MGWSKKYKKSIDCNNPKGFSQKAHCAGKKKNEDMVFEEITEDILNEKLITYGNRKPYGQIVFMAGGAGSGKGFAISNFVDSASFKIRDVDEMKKQIQILNRLGKLDIRSILKKYGRNIKLKDLDLIRKIEKDGYKLQNFNLKNPDHVYALHILVKAIGIKDASLEKLLLGKNNPETLPNILFDITAKDVTDITSILPKLKAVGYKPENVHLTWILTNYVTAMYNNKNRARMVPEDILLKTHEGASNTIWGLVTKALPKGMNGRVDVILNNPEHTVFFKDKDGKVINGNVKGFLSLPLKKEKGGIYAEKVWKNKLFNWVKDNAPESITSNMKESVVNEAKEPEVITQLRKIVKNKQNDLIKDTKSGKKVRIDMNSANLMVQVYDALKQQSNKDKFVKGGVVSMAHMAHKLMKNESVNEAKVNYNFSEDELKRVLKLLGRNASTEVKMIKAFEKAFGRKLTKDELFELVNEVGVNVWYFYKKANKNKNKFFKMLSDFRKNHSDAVWIKMLNYALEDFNENPKKYKTIDDKQNILFKNLQNNKKVYESVNEGYSKHFTYDEVVKSIVDFAKSKGYKIPSKGLDIIKGNPPSGPIRGWSRGTSIPLDKKINLSFDIYGVGKVFTVNQRLKLNKTFAESVNEGKFKVDDLVYNKRTKTVGIVRIADDKSGEAKTDADGNVNVDELEKYNPIKFKHQSKAKAAPSTQKEVSKRGLFNPFKNESVNEVKYYITRNQGRGRGKSLVGGYDLKKDKKLPPKEFRTFKDAEKEVKRLQNTQKGIAGGGSSYFVTDKKMNRLKESVNEAKVKRPVNRWLALKNDESMHAHKKMAMGLKELKYQLRETEKFFNWYNKIKTMNELDSDNYWKRTNKHIYKIKERLINIARTIQEIEK